MARCCRGREGAREVARYLLFEWKGGGMALQRVVLGGVLRMRQSGKAVGLSGLCCGGRLLRLLWQGCWTLVAGSADGLLSVVG